MTPEEYAKKTADRLKNDISNYEEILKNADEVVRNSNISQMSKDIFWISLSEYFNSDLMMENVSSEKLNAQVLATKQAIANRIMNMK
ncbi:hypothetical protein [Proteus mirabilis]|uniref:hypothetical protein n=1 Tax=Proteus mirabilis TaxID=584 RepID=UPI00217CD8AA|nr:hypothetical protein [Proteus mirabilis]MCS6724285.1 hypothetical protein [Proteus mirabilis]